MPSHPGSSDTLVEKRSTGTSIRMFPGKVKYTVGMDDPGKFEGRGVIPCYRPEKGVIETERLRLISFDLLRDNGGLQDRKSLEFNLGLRFPQGWPPSLLGRLLPPFLKARAERRPESADMAWLLVTKARASEPGVAVGLCGFLAPPDEEGRMEIRYAVMDPFSGKGLATEGATAVVAWAFRSGMARCIFAQTGKEEFAAMRILAKLGFVLISKGEGDTLLFERFSPFVKPGGQRRSSLT